MAADKRNIPFYLPDDATFRTWAQGIHDALLAIGLTNTTDTGQLDIATATRPASGSMAGYKIYKFNDTLQATNPIFIKVEYGSSGNGNAAGGLKFGVSTGTNGAGTLNGNVASTSVGSLRSNNPAASAMNVALWTTYSAAQGRFTLYYGDPAQTNRQQFFHVERTKGVDGVPDADGFLVMDPANFFVVPFGAAPPASAATVQNPNLSAGHHNTGPDVPLFPFIYACYGRAKVASVFWVPVAVAAYTEFSATIFGGAANMASTGDRLSIATSGPAFRFD